MDRWDDIGLMLAYSGKDFAVRERTLLINVSLQDMHFFILEIM